MAKTKSEAVKMAEAFNKGIEDQTLGAQFKSFDFAGWKSLDLRLEKRNGKHGEERRRLIHGDLSLSFDKLLVETDWFKACMGAAFWIHDSEWSRYTKHGGPNGGEYWAWSINDYYKKIVDCQGHMANFKRGQTSNAVMQFRVILRKMISQELEKAGEKFDLIPVEKLQFEQKPDPGFKPHFEESGLSTDDVIGKDSKHRDKFEHAKGVM